MPRTAVAEPKTPAEYQMPEVHVGDRVEVAAHPGAAWLAGLVMKVKTRAINVFSISEHRLAPRVDVWHETDPLVQDRPDVFSDPQANRGIFRLADSEVLQRKLLADVETLRTLVEKLVRDVGKR